MKPTTIKESRPVLRPYGDEDYFVDRTLIHKKPPALNLILPMDHPNVIYWLKEKHEFMLRVIQKGKEKNLPHDLGYDKDWATSHIDQLGYRRNREIRPHVWSYLHGELWNITIDDRFDHIAGELDQSSLGRHEVIVEHKGKRYDCIMFVYLDLEYLTYWSLTCLKDEADKLWDQLNLSPRTFELQGGGHVDLLTNDDERQGSGTTIPIE